MDTADALIHPPRAHEHAAGVVTQGLTISASGRTLLDAVDLRIEPGRVTAIIGRSGAGKTSLLRAMAGVAPAGAGSVTVDGQPVHEGTVRVAYVPQDDILPTELPLRRTLQYAAGVRMPTVGRAQLDAAVDQVLTDLDLTRHGDVPVHALSGGQRRRASIACELLTQPPVCFLDEPTSGLDPAASAELLGCLHRLADAGSTVVLTTHSADDVMRSDAIVVVAGGGRIAGTGTPDEVLASFGASDVAELYDRIPAAPPVGRADPIAPTRRPRRRPSTTSGAGAVRQWATLTRRSADSMVRNRLTLAITLGSPAAVTAMFAVLFQPGAFDTGVDHTAAVQAAYWLAFAGFFFGLTFGLLQVCAEVPVLRREHHAGVRTGAYLLSKVALLSPLLVAIDIGMVAVLQRADRIPDLSGGELVELHVTMALHALAALLLGLLASALVTSTAQAALALPMLCFPAVLFAGAMVPVPVMATAGQAIAAAMPDRWAYEAIARHLDVAALTPDGSPYASLGASSPPTYWALLAGFVLALGAAAHLAVRRRAV